MPFPLRWQGRTDIPHKCGMCGPTPDWRPCGANVWALLAHIKAVSHIPVIGTSLPFFHFKYNEKGGETVGNISFAYPNHQQRKR